MAGIGTRLALLLCLMGMASPAHSQTLVAERTAEQAASQTRLHIACTANLRATYASPIAARQLSGAAFRDPAAAAQTLAACAALTQAQPSASAHLWHAMALVADGRPTQALGPLAKLPPMAQGEEALGFMSLEPRAQGASLRRAVVAGFALGQTHGQASAILTAQLAQPSRADLAGVAALVSQGSLSQTRGLRTFAGARAYDALDQVYRGQLPFHGAQAEALGPDLRALRANAQLWGQAPLAAYAQFGTLQGASYFDRGWAAQDLSAELSKAQALRAAAFAQGFDAWFDLDLPEGDRDQLVASAVRLTAGLFDGEAQSTGAALTHTFAQAIRLDWGGLRSVQGYDLRATLQRAADLGSAQAEGELLLSHAAQQRAQGAPLGDEALANLSAQMQALANADACLYAPWAEARLLGLLNGRQDLLQAQALLAQGQEAGAASAFVAAGELLRWGQGAGRYDFAGARQLFAQALELPNPQNCGREAAARAHLHLGWMYTTGQAGQVDLLRGQAHLRAAVSVGSFDGAEALAEMYFFGIGVPQDPVLAFEMASKAHLWNNRTYQLYLVFSLHAAAGLAPPELSATPSSAAGAAQSALPLAPLQIAVAGLAEARDLGAFQGVYSLAQFRAGHPAVAATLPELQAEGPALADLSGHVGDFARAYAAQGPVRDALLANMAAALSGQRNLAFTAARYDTAAGLHHDPARALLFYRALAEENETARALLLMDRFAYLSPAAQQVVGQGPLNLLDIAALDMFAELGPLPLPLLAHPPLPSE